MRKHGLLVSFAALCAAVTNAGAMPVALAPSLVEIVKPVRYGADAYRHRGFYYRQHRAYFHDAGRRRYRYRR